MREIKAHELFNPVFEHVADHESYKNRKREIAVFLLERKRDNRGENHGHTRGETEKNLFQQERVSFFSGDQVQIAFNVFFQHPGPENKFPVVRFTFGIDGTVILFPFIISLVYKKFL